MPATTLPIIVPMNSDFMSPSTFWLPTAASFMAFSNWSLHSGLLPWYSLSFTYSHRKESNAFQ